MDLIHLIILALIQGITEFLPVSSSAHLILVPVLTEWQDQGLAIDVAAHLGSLFAVIFYFRKDIARILVAGIESISKQKIDNIDSKLFWYLVLASIPVLVTGFIFRGFISTYLREPLVIAGTSIGFGLLLWYADVYGKRIRRLESLSIGDVIIIGIAQVFALIPGTSRSGITITAGLLLGLDRVNAARFSFLMSVPIIFIAGAYEAVKLIQAGAGMDIFNFIFTTFLSAISAFAAIHYFLRFIDRIGMLPFVIYRVILGVVLIFIFI
ncbi:MAG: undecaprenyl-diphosphate phosphatase [Proteobacteria bacterium]|nr:undecaprenyl-diphosphate phosphatase [Pseudomonadota bacterium]